MVSKSSKAHPFIVVAITTIFLAVDLFTAFEITDEMIQIIVIIFTPIGIGGLINKGWHVYKDVKCPVKNGSSQPDNG